MSAKTVAYHDGKPLCVLCARGFSALGKVIERRAHPGSGVTCGACGHALSHSREAGIAEASTYLVECVNEDGVVDFQFITSAATPKTATDDAIKALRVTEWFNDYTLVVYAVLDSGVPGVRSTRKTSTRRTWRGSREEA